MFTILEGAVDVTFRDETLTAVAGETINVPANSAHAFRNAGDRPARRLCMCAPAGQEEFFTAVGESVRTRTEAPAPLDPSAQAAFMAKTQSLAPCYPFDDGATRLDRPSLSARTSRPGIVE